MTKIGLFGAAGHMGTALIRAISESDSVSLSGGCDREGSPKIGQDLGIVAGLPPIGLSLSADNAGLCSNADVVVDYSAASATMSLIPVAIDCRTPVLVCTTGFSEAQRRNL